MVHRSMYGVFLDVTARKQAEEASELLAGEMGHRVKNLLAIASGLTQLTSHSADTVEDMAHQLMERLMALDRAHNLVKPLPEEQGKAALLGDLISIRLSPYDSSGAFSGRIRVAVPRMGVGEKVVTTLAMVFHELATNSVKHGCLSSPTGMLDISTRIQDDELTFVWAESGGPRIEPAPTRSGFGSSYIERTVARQFNGTINYEWEPEGLVARLTLARDRLSA